MITILSTLLFLLVHGCMASTEVRLQSVIRGDRGNLLKVACGTDTRPFQFTGADASDAKTELHLEDCECKKANTLKFRAGSNNYYLSAESGGQVKLRKLDAFPEDDKYFFKIRQTSKGSATVSLKSVATGQYLQSADTGVASMKTVEDSELDDGRPRDQKTWFKFVM